jgi:MFS superfamily sulfate permease-like transporter
MDWLAILDRYGIAVGIAIAMAFYIWKSTKYIQDDLSKDMHQKFDRLEGILIKLIDNSKKQEIKQEGLNRSYRTLVEIIAKLSGNGLKHKFKNMLNKDR